MADSAVTTLDKTPWGPGLWQYEPDVVAFVEGSTGYPIRLNRHPVGGYWCGYVGVPASHVAYGVTTPRTIPVGAPGGLTYAGPDAGGQGASWWIGFDAGSPAGAQPGAGVPGVYVSVSAMRAQTVQLALDLKRVQDLTSLPTPPTASSASTLPSVPSTNTAATAAGATVSAATSSSGATVSVATGATVPTSTSSGASVTVSGTSAKLGT